MNTPVKLRPGDIAALEQLLRDRNIFERYGLERIGVYGSFARGEAYRDIDLLIDPYLAYRIRMEMKAELEELTGSRVDLVVRELMDPIVMYRASKDLTYAVK
jgi:predicted nucleotidyltransferase